MGLIDSVRNFRTKAPQFIVTNTPQYQDYTYLNDSDQYLDQYLGWTYKAVKLKADTMAMYEPKLFQEKSNDESVEVPSNTQILKDLRRFNGFMTYSEARRITWLHLGLAGLAYWYICKSDTRGYKAEFYILDPQRMKIKVDSFGLPREYIFQDVIGNQNSIPPEQLIVFREPNPQNWLKGWSPLKATRYEHNSLELGNKYNMNSLGNNGRPDGFLMLEGISDTEREKLENQLRQKYTGANNGRKVGIVNNIIQFLEVSKGQKELDFINSMKMMRDNLLAIHGVPLDLLGMGGTTFSNASEAQRIFQRYTIKPMLQIEESVLNEQLLSRYYSVTRDDLYFEFPDPVDADSKMLAEEANILFSGNIITRNEAREIVGHPAEDDGDVYSSESTAPEQVVVDNTEAQQELAKMKQLIEKQMVLIKTIPDVEEKIMRNREEMKMFFNNKQLESESIFETVTKDYFDNQSERIVKDLKSVSMKTGFDVDKEAKKAVMFFSDIYNSEARKYTQIAEEMIGIDTKTKALSAAARRKLQENLEYFSKEINETTKKDLEELLANAIENGDSIDDVKFQIKQLFDNYNENDALELVRAAMIARTEINLIKNLTARDTYVSNEFVTGLEWLSAHDSAVREAHLGADGQVVPKGVKFNVGGELLEYPGDNNGSAGNVINCRCTVIPVIE